MEVYIIKAHLENLKGSLTRVGCISNTDKKMTSILYSDTSGTFELSKYEDDTVKYLILDEMKVLLPPKKCSSDFS